MDTRGNLAVADFGNNRVQLFNRVIPSHQMVQPFGGTVTVREVPDSALSPLWLIGPTDVGVRTRGVFWVTDSGNSRIVSRHSGSVQAHRVDRWRDVSVDASPPMDVVDFDPRAVLYLQSPTRADQTSINRRLRGFVTAAANLSTNVRSPQAEPPRHCSFGFPSHGFLSRSAGYRNSPSLAGGAQSGMFVATVTVEIWRGRSPMMSK
jgi:hypothetical protein